MLAGIDKIFKSKILLFGEYAVMMNEKAKALSMPFEEFQGMLNFSPVKLPQNHKADSNNELRKYHEYLSDLDRNNELPCTLNLVQMGLDIDAGLVFDSSIPQGSGLGSSGAMIANIYHNYAVNPIPSSMDLDEHEMNELKSVFSTLETYFHGKSSGLDPLICYLSNPVLVEADEQLKQIEVPGETVSGKGAIFLVNTGIVGRTNNLVDFFLKCCEKVSFLKLMKEEFIYHNNQCVKALMNKDKEQLMHHVKYLTKFTLEHFKPMIPDTFKGVWEKGLNNQKYFLKLCGSGGGGFLLGFAPDFEAAKEELKEYDLKIVQRI